MYLNVTFPCSTPQESSKNQKGMSWREAGSRSLGILRVINLNHQWQRFWFPEEAANDSEQLLVVNS